MVHISYISNFRLNNDKANTNEFHPDRSSPAGTVTQDDILDITEALQEDSRWKALDRLDADRKLLLFQHLGFVHCPMREHCPAFPHCTDSLVERIMAKKAHRPPSWSRTTDNNHLNLVVLGCKDLAEVLADAVRVRPEVPTKLEAIMNFTFTFHLSGTVRG